MSTISGTCSESVASTLFKQGIEQTQTKKLEDQHALKTNQTLQPSTDNNMQLEEGLKGSIINTYA
ncbi:MAG: hypothetical protein OEZ58_01220 [Gammaproteobacteria bacterium]|nr:hypothetical protein [Gammaproteobacteria bacterium]MDH5727597.1 hypothetical protein [Gammaproteobacteria bacterium]